MSLEIVDWQKHAANAVIVTLGDYHRFNEWWAWIEADGRAEILDAIAAAIHDQHAAGPAVLGPAADAGEVTDEAILKLAQARGAFRQAASQAFRIGQDDLLAFARALLSQAQGQKGTFVPEEKFEERFDDAERVGWVRGWNACRAEVMSTTAASPSPDPEREKLGEDAPCKCGQMTIPPWAGSVEWYWQSHARDSCTLELPNARCWCGLLRSEHVSGHNDPENKGPPTHAMQQPSAAEDAHG